ncbi:hypothetical protein Acr_27g0001250 [Actinidia rufa]|uniref:Uncharacterized protein n=1 Tax=Actinidia rufa TaxID=165716 RepID=A0A7J0H5L0_9ERIC|nr:hypothetical protein Acr_27g0001250 [Actinidia rufa]
METTIMTLGDLDRLRELYSFLPGVQVRLLKGDETIMSALGLQMNRAVRKWLEARLGGKKKRPPLLRNHHIDLPRLFFLADKSRSMHLYVGQGLLCFTLDLDASSTHCMYRGKMPVDASPTLFHVGQGLDLDLHVGQGCLYSLFNNPKLDSRWLYFKGMNGNFPLVHIGNMEFRRFRDHWAPQCNKLPILIDLEDWTLKIFKRLGQGFFNVPIVLSSKMYQKCFASYSEKMASSDGNNAEDNLAEGTAVMSDEGESRPFRGLGPCSLNSSSDSELESCYVKKNQFKKACPKGGRIQGRKLGGEVGLDNEGYRYSVETSKGRAKKKARSKTTAIVEASIGVTRLVALRKGTSANLVAALGPKVTMLRSSTTVEKILEAIIRPFDKEEVDKLELDQMVSKFFHILGQAVVVGSFLVSRSWEIRDKVTLQQSQAALLEGEMSRAQKMANKMEEQLTEARIQNQQATEELAKVMDDQEAIAEKLAKLEMVVADLRSKEAREGFEDASSKYFGEGFDFYKRRGEMVGDGEVGGISGVVLRKISCIEFHGVGKSGRSVLDSVSLEPIRWQRSISEVRDDLAHPCWICYSLTYGFGDINDGIWQELQRVTPV